MVSMVVSIKERVGHNPKLGSSGGGEKPNRNFSEKIFAACAWL
ncbi:hypothetical protein T8T21_16105 (plasmid) [Limimaricola variabilis]|nr:hypothetical protein [Limimaricola variabilis]WPY96296.1 hypothetical protein T8T21_16105 [Limimaricola variabilis]